MNRLYFIHIFLSSIVRNFERYRYWEKIDGIFGGISSESLFIMSLQTLSNEPFLNEIIDFHTLDSHTLDSHTLDLYFLDQMYPTNLTPAFSLAELAQVQEYIKPQFPTTNKHVECIVTCSFPVSTNEKERLQKEYMDCPICLESISKWDSVSLICRHSFCTSCVSNHLDSFHTIIKCKDIPGCALCRAHYVFLDIPNMENMIKLEQILHK